jgi:hypothetical protein
MSLHLGLDAGSHAGLARALPEVLSMNRYVEALVESAFGDVIEESREDASLDSLLDCLERAIDLRRQLDAGQADCA